MHRYSSILFLIKKKIKIKITQSLSTFVGQEGSTESSQQFIKTGNVNEVYYLQATSIPSFKPFLGKNYYFHVQARYDLFSIPVI